MFFNSIYILRTNREGGNQYVHDLYQWDVPQIVPYSRQLCVSDVSYAWSLKPAVATSIVKFIGEKTSVCRNVTHEMSWSRQFVCFSKLVKSFGNVFVVFGHLDANVCYKNKRQDAESNNVVNCNIVHILHLRPGQRRNGIPGIRRLLNEVHYSSIGV